MNYQMPDTHRLKTESEDMAEIFMKIRTFEICKHDQDFKTGDDLLLQERKRGKLTGWGCETRIRCVKTSENCEGLLPGYVILGLEFIKTFKEKEEL